MTTSAQHPSGRPEAAHRARRLFGDEAGSLPLAMLLTLVGVSLSALIAPTVLNQIGSTRQSIERAHALHAAQAGIDVALGQIRGADDANNGTGQRASLPCWTTYNPAYPPLTGRVGAGGTARYRVTVDYLTTDPQGQAFTTQGDVVQSWIDANDIPCAIGGGAFNTPAYVLLRSVGTDHSTGSFDAVPTRSLWATYTVKTTDRPSAGGLIHTFPRPGYNDLCMDASADPAPGVILRMQPCVPNSDRQKFSYTTNLTVMYVGRKLDAYPQGLCLDAGTNHSAGVYVHLRACLPVGSSGLVPYGQVWINSDGGNFYSVDNDYDRDGYCMILRQNNDPGTEVVLFAGSGKQCSKNPDKVETFSLDPQVGAGRAGASSGQLVNFYQFGRCLDVPGADVGRGYLIAWPCKQALDPSEIAWNQRWALPAVDNETQMGTGRITTSPPSGTYCLVSPLSNAAGTYVTVARCPSGPLPTNMRWTVYGDTGSRDSSYRIMDRSSPNRFCLAPTDMDAPNPDLNPTGNASKIIVAACNASSLQKWNAPADFGVPPLKDINER